MLPALNPLVLSLKESATLAINEKARALRAEGRDIYHFGFGQSPFAVPEIIRKALCDNAGQNRYAPTAGLPELREAVASFYKKEFGYHFDASNVCIGPGSKELIFETIFLMEGALLVPTPSWVSYGPQAALRGKRLYPIQTKKENSYKITAEELDAVCAVLGQEQKLLVLNNPTNPTGAVYTDEEFREIAEICRAYSVIVISDEVYALLDFTGEPQASLAHHYPEGTIVSGGLSKAFSAGGYRLGVMLIPEEMSLVIQALKSVISETFSAVSTPVQYAAIAAYSRFEEIRSYVEKTRDIHAAACRYTHRRILDMGLNCPEPRGAFYLFPDFDNYREELRKRHVLTGVRLCEKLLEEVGVAVLPGASFYFPATNLGARFSPVDYDGQTVFDAWGEGAGADEATARRFFPSVAKGCDVLAGYLSAL